MRPDIDSLLDKYWDGNTSLEEERLLKTYFQSGQVQTEHLPFQDLFGWMDHQSAMTIDISLDIDTLLDKYWEGETSLKEEEILKSYFKSGNIEEHHIDYSGLFEYFETQKSVVFPQDSIASNQSIPSEKVHKTKIFTLKKILFGVAAASVLVFGALTVFQWVDDNKNQQQSAQVVEIDDPEEALRVTKEALALVSTKFRESQKTVRENMEPLEKAAIFK